LAQRVLEESEVARLSAAAREFRVERSENQSKLLKQLREFDVYIRNNQDYNPNYGERYRNGVRIATSFVESTVNQVVSKRMAKKPADGMDGTGSASTAAGTHLSVERGIGRNVPPLVPEISM
jgi:hypothetical protein